MIIKTILLPTVICLLLLTIIGMNTVFSEKALPTKEEVIWTKPENKISIAHTEIFGILERPQVIFDHNKHTEAFKQEGCKTCHPVDEWGDFRFDFPKKVEKKDKTSVMNAYHDECMGCHKKSVKVKEKSGPVICADCHKEELLFVHIKYPVFEFDFAYHDNHVKKLREKLGKDDCSLCHHIYDPEEEDETLRLVYEKGTEESCYYCHDLDKKRGPELTVITRAAAKKGLTIQKASHLQCLNCHFKYTKELEILKKKKDEKAGPLECTKCHTGKYKTIAELAKVPRPDRNQPEKPFIGIENARMKGVPLNHSSHEKYNRTCRGCHHETLNACKKCHSVTGIPEGRQVNTANAYHNVFSEHSCAGCHNMKKKEKDCAGCHSNIPQMGIETMGPGKKVCSLCHTGRKEPPTPTPLNVAQLDPEKVKKEVTVKILENEYEPSKFPHLKIIQKLVKISNESKLATYFHANMQTICDGCHHQSRAEAEAKKDTPPYCENCHSVTNDFRKTGRTRLLSAYHRQCLGCHEMMDLEKGRKCSECHKEKKEVPKSITSVKNFELPVRFLEKLGW